MQELLHTVKKKSSEYKYLFSQFYLLTAVSVRKDHTPDANHKEAAVQRCDHTESQNQSQSHRTGKVLGGLLEGTTMGHLVQPPSSGRLIPA